jgi:hypothetical protein
VVLKRDTGGLVVKWVTIGESPLLYVFIFAACVELVRKKIFGYYGWCVCIWRHTYATSGCLLMMVKRTKLIQ